MKTYTEDQVKKIIEYACGYQKAASYQEIGNIKGFWDIDEDVFKSVMDNLADTDNNASGEISLSDIDDIIHDSNLGFD